MGPLSLTTDILIFMLLASGVAGVVILFVVLLVLYALYIEDGEEDVRQ